MVNILDIIAKKRDGGKLNKEEIEFFVKGYVSGDIPDYQAASLLMAIYIQGMDEEETTNLTLSMRDSGDKLNLDMFNLTADKHSTGGVGDKTSLVVCPIAASCGIKMPKMSGRGLGHTGGTIDKLESIPGYKANISEKEFIDITNKVGFSIIGQTKNMVPADKKIYALRDVTSTVGSIPLIASSIMSKKLAAGNKNIVLDVKVGSGAFMKTPEEARVLAQLMVKIGKNAGCNVMAILSNMDIPLGNAIGNTLEIIEAINTLKGEGPEDFTRFCIKVSSYIMCLCKKGTYDECEKMAINALKIGSAFNTFKKFIELQGGNVNYIEDTNLFAKAKYSLEVKAANTGYIVKQDTTKYGDASVLLGAGRIKKEDSIDHTAGILLFKKVGDYVIIGDTICTLYSNDKSKLSIAEKLLLEFTKIDKESTQTKVDILEIIK